MYLGIDPSGAETIRVYYAMNDTWEYQDFSAQGEQTILTALQHVLEHNKYSTKDIRGIAVVVGAGRFTGTRVAVTVANTLVYALQIPALAVPAGTVFTSELLQQLVAAPAGQYILPVYSAPASVGQKK